jgi:hypothetical protein
VQEKCALFLIFVLLSHLTVGQTNATQAVPAPTGHPSDQPLSQQTAPSAEQALPIPYFISAKGFVLEDATPVRLRFNRTVSSADARMEESVDFEVLQDVSVNGTLVIPKGGIAVGTVTEAQPKRRLARGGKLEINVDYVKLLNGDKAALRAVKGGNGGGHTVAMTAGIVATGILFFPAAPFFLFIKGKDITLPKGTEFTAYINGDLKLDLAKFQPAASGAQPTQDANVTNHDQSATPSFAKLQIESTPSGADIEVDGSFAGSTPSDVQVTEGDHTVVVKKSGFKDWERKLKSIAGSSVHLSAELETTDK